MNEVWLVKSSAPVSPDKQCETTVEPLLKVTLVIRPPL